MIVYVGRHGKFENKKISITSFEAVFLEYSHKERSMLIVIKPRLKIIKTDLQ